MIKKILLLSFVVVFVAALVVGGYVYTKYEEFGQWLVTPAGGDIVETVEIEQGSSLLRVLHLLAEKKLIKPHELMRYIAKLNPDLPHVKAGEFELSSSLSPLDLIRQMSEGKVKLYPLTVREGLRLEEIAQVVEKAGHGRASEFMKIVTDPEFIEKMRIPAKKLEGYLLPETYKFPKGYTLEMKIKAMVDGYHSVVGPKEIEQAKKMGLNEHQLVTLASIIEKETGAPQERPIIASVFLNRLKRNMLLQTDPTVIYGIENFDGNITRKHLQTPHPYNTYVHPGLPPGPIAAPGKEAIQAVLHPADTDYLYFVAMNNGRHKFSKTLAEHNHAVRVYQIQGKVGP